MASRDARLITKRTSVPGKVPTGTTLFETNLIRSGELASNLADKKLFGYDGTNAFEYGSNSFFGLTGGTVTGDTRIIGSLSADTLFSGSTNLETIIRNLNTYVQPGSNIVTGGTPTLPTVSIVDSPSFNELTASGDTTLEFISGTSISINGGEVMTRIVDSEDFQLFENMAGSGVIYYEGISANTIDNTKFDIGPVKGWIVDNTTDPMNPTVQYIDYSGSTGDSPSGVTLNFLAINPATYVGLTGNTTADITQSTTRYSTSQHRDLLELGAVIHSNNTTVNAINNFADISIDPVQQVYDLIHGLGIFNIESGGKQGNAFSANGASLNIDKTSGDIFSHGSNYLNDPKNPHIKSLASASTITFRYRLPDGTEFGDTTEVNSNIYDNGGVTAATPDNKFTVQRVTLFANNFTRWQYGQNIYDSLDDAEATLSTEDFVTEPAIENGLLRAFLIVKQGTEDLSNTKEARFISASHFGHANDTVVGNVHRTEILNNTSTGLRAGGMLSINTGDTTMFDVSAGDGVVIDNTTDPDNPVLTEVTWGVLTGNTIFSADAGTFVMIDVNGDVFTLPSSTPPSGADRRVNIFLGLAGHAKGFIEQIFNYPIRTVSPISQIDDLSSSIGPFSISGNKVSGIAGTLELFKTSGRSFFNGGNFQVDNTNPSTFNTALLSASTLVYAKSDQIYGLSASTIDPDNYDLDGTITSVPTNDYAAHRIWHQPDNNILIFQYGQAAYNTEAAAKDGFITEEYEVPTPLDTVSYLVSVIIIQEGEGDISNAVIIPQGKFAGSGGGGGGSVDTLQTAYNNSTQPEILTDPTRGPVDFRVGSGVDSDQVVTVQQNDGTVNAYVTGEGDAVFNTLSGITGVDFNLSSTDNFLIDGETNLRGITVGAIRQLHKPSIPGTRAYNLQINANGYGDTKGTEVNYVATNYTSGLTSTVHNINIDTDNASGGTVEGYRVNKIGLAGVLDVHALVIGSEIDVIKHSSGVAGNMNIAFTADTSFTTFSDVTTSFTSTTVDTEIFVSNGDYVVVGDSNKFNKISFLLDTPSDGAGTLPTFEYSSGLSGWTSFTPVDNTNGFRQNGAIVYNIDDLGSWVTDTVNGVSSKYWVRIRRTNLSGITTPIEDIVQITTPQQFEWDKDGNVIINNMSGNTYYSGATPLETIIQNIANSVDTFITGVTITGDTTLVLQRNDGTNVTTDLSIQRDLSLNAVQFTLNTASIVTLTPLVMSVVRFAGTGAIDDAGVNFVVPEDYKDGGEFNTIWRSSTTLTTLSAKTFFDMYTGDTNNTGSLITSVETFSILDTPEATANVFIFSPTVSPTTILSPGMKIHFRVYRDPGDSQDTLNSDMDVSDLVFTYNALR